MALNKLYTVYILGADSKRNWLYVGCTSDLKRRLAEHNSGKMRSTKGYAPFKLLYSEEHSNIKEARLREKFLKSRSGLTIKRKLALNSGVV